jgi:hypothetical protein
MVSVMIYFHTPFYLTAWFCKLLAVLVACLMSISCFFSLVKRVKKTLVFTFVSKSVVQVLLEKKTPLNVCLFICTYKLMVCNKMTSNAANISLSLLHLYISMLGTQSNLRFGGEWNRSVGVEQQQNPHCSEINCWLAAVPGRSSVLEKRPSRRPSELA